MQKAPFYDRIQRISQKSSDLFSCPSTPSLSSLLSKKPREQDLWDEDETQSNCERRSTIPQCDRSILYPCSLLMRNKWQVLQKLLAILQPNTHITTLTFVPASPETTCRPLRQRHAFIICRGDVAKTGNNIKVRGVRPSADFWFFTAWFLYNVQKKIHHQCAVKR